MSDHNKLSAMSLKRFSKKLEEARNDPDSLYLDEFTALAQKHKVVGLNGDNRNGKPLTPTEGIALLDALGEEIDDCPEHDPIGLEEELLYDKLSSVEGLDPK